MLNSPSILVRTFIVVISITMMMVFCAPIITSIFYSYTIIRINSLIPLDELYEILRLSSWGLHFNILLLLSLSLSLWCPLSKKDVHQLMVLPLIPVLKLYIALHNGVWLFFRS